MYIASFCIRLVCRTLIMVVKLALTSIKLITSLFLLVFRLFLIFLITGAPE